MRGNVSTLFDCSLNDKKRSLFVFREALDDSFYFVFSRSKTAVQDLGQASYCYRKEVLLQLLSPRIDNLFFFVCLVVRGIGNDRPGAEKQGPALRAPLFLFASFVVNTHTSQTK